jgi:hypothetical protein
MAHHGVVSRVTAMWTRTATRSGSRTDGFVTAEHVREKLITHLVVGQWSSGFRVSCGDHATNNGKGRSRVGADRGWRAPRRRAPSRLKGRS